MLTFFRLNSLPDSLLLATLLLGAIGFVAAVILFFASKFFYVEEDPLIDEVSNCLPLANCGGCGFPGCKGLAEAIVKAGSMNGLICPAGNNKINSDIAKLLDIEAVASIPCVAVLHCNEKCNNASVKAIYDSAISCAFAATISAGKNACPYGCLSFGDCVSVCKFDAISVNSETRFPEIDEKKCTGCSACVKVCPRNLIEIIERDIFEDCNYEACIKLKLKKI